MAPVHFLDNRSLVADASFWINIIAGGRAEEVLRALCNPLQIPRIALDELERGRDKGRATAQALTHLIEADLVRVIDLPETAEGTFLSLVAGAISQTLDDGEAATLALSLEIGGCAIIDERKAISLAASRFPKLLVVTTSDLLLSEPIRTALSPRELSDLFFAALTNARMRVPEHLLETVCECIGKNRVSQCVSLPARVRNTAEGEQCGS